MHLFQLIIFLFLLFIAPCQAEQSLYDPQGIGPVAVAKGGPLIQELSLKDVEMPEAIGLIAQKSGLNIILDQGITGRVTVFLRRVDAREALRIVLESSGLAFSEDDGIIRVMTAEAFKAKYGYVFGQDVVSRIIKLNFVAPSDAQKMLDEVKSSQGKVVVNPEARTVLLMDGAAKVQAMERLLSEVDVLVATRTITLKNVRVDSLVPEVRRLLTQSIGSLEANQQDNSLTVTDTPARIEKVRKAIDGMDARGRVVMLEAKLVHVVLNDEHRNGVDWTGILDDYQRMRLMKKYDFLVGTDNGRALSLGMIRKDDFSTLIEALDTVGYVQEYPLSIIRVTGTDQVRMVVRLDDPSVDMSVIAGDDQGGAQDLPAGGAAMAFSVKTVVDGAGDVMMTLLPEDGNGLPGKPAASMPGHVIGAHEGYTAVMGGMIVSERIAAGHKIPLLGDLPLVGFAFRMDGLVRKEEFVVFLTPRRVSLSQILADDALVPMADGLLTGVE
ncbi:MAG: secretin N-terminal domain-containing protein [Candidatus Omnitrophota bacterium]